MTTHISILAWRIPWAVEPGELYSPWCRKDLDTAEVIEHARMHLGNSQKGQADME